MRKLFTTALLTGALTAVPLVASAYQTGSKPQPPKPSQAQPASKSTAKSTAATHTMTGVVKSVDDSTLVITRSGKNAGETTFMLNPQTHRAGTVEVGSSVSVRYREDGNSNVATAITVQHKKQTAPKPPSR
jgi:hypothetical protein